MIKPLMWPAALALALSACGTVPLPSPPVFVDPLSPAQRMAEVEAVAGSLDNELNVQPLRDGQVQDLREQAQDARNRGDLGQAGQLLDQALALVDNDPAIWQERAEVALLAAEPAAAEQLARQALALGSRTGPLCRRHWATVWQSQLARNDTLNAASAQAQIEGCTVPPIQRY